MEYVSESNIYIQENGLQFSPCVLKDYEKFAWMISVFDGTIYYTNNISDKAIDRIIKQTQIDHPDFFGWMSHTGFTPIADEKLFALIPEEVKEMYGLTPSRIERIVGADYFCLQKFGDKSDNPLTWKWVQEKGKKLRHFKSPRCIKEKEVKKLSPTLLSGSLTAPELDGFRKVTPKTIGGQN